MPETRLLSATRGQRGFALLIVLWTLGLLALLVTQLVAAGRSEAQLAANLRGAAVAEAAADGAVQMAILRLADASEHRWAADGTTHTVRVGGAAAEVTIADEGGKVSLNIAAPPLLQALLEQVGVEPSAAARLASAIVDWRSRRIGAQARVQGGAASASAAAYAAAGRAWGPPNTPFRTVDELGLVLGVTPELLDRLAPHVSPWPEDVPKLAAADRVVRAAVQRAVEEGGLDAPDADSDAPLIARLIATGAGPGGARFTRRAVVRVEPTGDGTRPWRVLEWEEG